MWKADIEVTTKWIYWKFEIYAIQVCMRHSFQRSVVVVLCICTPNLSQINYCYLAAFKWLLSSSWFSVCFRSVFPLQFCFSPPLQHCLLNFKNYSSKDFSSTGQVRLFLSEDSPLQSGQRMQDLLQAKAAWLLPAAGLKSEDSLLPGFEERRRDQHPQIEILQIPLIRWQCPPRVGVSPNLLSCKL